MVTGVMEPGLVGRRAGLVEQIRLGVCPLGGRRPVESLYLPVGRQMIGTGVAVLDFRTERRCEAVRAVARPVEFLTDVKRLRRS
jgi:hypothetical protein